MKIVIGFFFGLMVAGALAQGRTEGHGYLPSDIDLNTMNAVIMAASGPDGRPAVIKVDVQGHVICSTEKQ